MVEGRDLGDAEILRITAQETGENDKVRLKTQLPSGRTITSEWLEPGNIKVSVLNSWCDNIRAQVDFDNEEERAAKKREPLDAQPSSSSTKKEAEAMVAEESDPIQFSIRHRDAYEARVHTLEARITEMKNERKVMREHYEKWEKVVNMLRGEVDE